MKTVIIPDVSIMALLHNTISEQYPDAAAMGVFLGVTDEGHVFGRVQVYETQAEADAEHAAIEKRNSAMPAPKGLQ